MAGQRALQTRRSLQRLTDRLAFAPRHWADQARSSDANLERRQIESLIYCIRGGTRSSCLSR